MENMSAGKRKTRGNYYSSEYRGKIDLSSKIGQPSHSLGDKVSENIRRCLNENVCMYVCTLLSFSRSSFFFFIFDSISQPIMNHTFSRRNFIKIENSHGGKLKSKLRKIPNDHRPNEYERNLNLREE